MTTKEYIYVEPVTLKVHKLNWPDEIEDKWWCSCGASQEGRWCPSVNALFDSFDDSLTDTLVSNARMTHDDYGNAFVNGRYTDEYAYVDGKYIDMDC